jgi:DNA-directed RNA polymerase specialized sigma24 family protein
VQSPVEQNMTLDSIARDYGRMVSSICRRMIMDEEVARDAAQQVWVEITQSFQNVRKRAWHLMAAAEGGSINFFFIR